MLSKYFAYVCMLYNDVGSQSANDANDAKFFECNAKGSRFSETDPWFDARIL